MNGGETIATWIFLGSFALSALLCFALVRSIRNPSTIVTASQEHSQYPWLSHLTGIIIVAAMLGVVGLYAYAHHSVPHYWPVLMAASVIALVSYIDAVKSLPLWFVLLTQCVFILPLTNWMMEGETLLYGFMPTWLCYVVCAGMWLWIMNFTNYMDGGDGLAASHSAIVLIGTSLIVAFYIKDIAIFYASISLAGAILGALLFNWYPAYLRLGRAGTVPIGLFLGWFMLSLIKEEQFIPALLLMLYFVADSGYTFFTRLLNGETIIQVKNGYFYQVALSQGKKPSHINTTIISIHASLVLLAVTTPSLSQLEGLCLILGVGLVIWLLYWMQRPQNATT